MSTKPPSSRFSPERPRSQSQDALAEIARVATAPGLLSAAATPETGRAKGPAGRVFVGRGEPLRELTDLLDAVRAGRGGFALLTGDPGIGKTRLIDHFLQQPGDGILVAWGRCFEDDADRAYAPWREAIGSLLQQVDRSALKPALLADLDRLATGEPTLSAGSGGATAASFALGHAVAALAKACGPTLLVLEDLHWADRASFHLLERLAPMTGHLPLAIVATGRSGELWQDPTRRPGFTSLLRTALPIALSPFTYDEIGALLEAFGRPSSSTIIQRLMMLTGGNPFLLNDALRTGNEATGDLEPTIGGKLFLEAHLDRLDTETLSLLQYLAVFGHKIDVSRAAAHLKNNFRHALALLERARTGGVIVACDDVHPYFVFSHDLLRQSILKRIAHADRLKLHLQIAGELGAEESAAPGSAREIARHLRAASPLADTALVTRWCQRAGRQTLAEADPLGAVDWFQRALDCQLRANPGGVGPADLLLDMATACAIAGNRPRADGLYAYLVEHARAVGDAGLFADAVLGTVNPRNTTGQIDWTITDLLAEALGAVGEARPRQRAALRARLGTYLYFSGDLARSRKLTELALKEGAGQGDPKDRHMLLRARRLTLWGPDAIDAQEAITAQLLTLATAAPLGLEEMEFARLWAVVDALGCGSGRQFEKVLEKWRISVDGTRHPGLISSFRLANGMREIMRGHLEAAEASIESITQDLREVDDPGAENRQQYCAAQLFMIYRERRALEPLETSLRILIEEYPELTIWHSGLALLLLETGRLPEARAELAKAEARGFASLARDGNWLTTLALWAEVAAAPGGEAKTAEQILALLTPHASRHVVVPLAAGCLGSVHRYLGQLQAVLNRPAEAIASFERALNADTKSGDLLNAAHDRVSLAAWLPVDGKPASLEAATRLLSKSRDFATEHGLPRLLERIESVKASRIVTTKTDRELWLPPAAKASLRPDGQGWLVGFAGRVGQLRPSRGLHQLHRLLQIPGQGLTALSLLSAGAEEISTQTAARLSGELNLRQGKMPEALLDRQARGELRQRLRELDDEITEADANADLGRAEILRSEHAWLLEEITAAIGLGNRPNQMPSAEARARINVTRTLRKAIGDIRLTCPELGTHLERCVTTGRICSYDPDPTAPIDFSL